MNAAANLTLVPGGSALPTFDLSNDQKIQAIRDTVGKGATDAEFAMFMHLANTYRLDPFLKEIWFIKYGTNQPQIMVSRDGLRNYAQRQGDMLAFISQEVRQGDTFKFNPITKEIHHEIGDGSGQITKAYCIIKREEKDDHIEIVDFHEYFTALSGKNGVWKSHPSAMIKKVAEVLALKKCYTITGLYAPEEMGMQEPVDVTPQEDKAQIAAQQRMATKRKSLFATARDKGISDDDLKETMFALYGKQSTKDLTEQELSELVQHVKKHQPKPPEDTPPPVDSDSGEKTADELGLNGDDPMPWEVD